MSDNQLEVIVRESGLEPTKARVMLDQFSDAFKFAAEWDERSKTLVVTDASQTAVMQMARTGRLELKAKRVEIEKTRKQLKEQALREGKAIDGIANVLKALIVPIEERLDEQEHFVERQQAAAEEARRQAAEEALLEKERREAEAEALRIKEQEAENERLRKEAVEREAALEKERKAAAAELARINAEAEAERKEAAAKLEQQRKANEAELERERKRAAEAAKAEAEKKARVAAQAADKARKLAEKEAAEREANLQEQLRLARMVTCPKCGHEFDSGVK